MDWNRAIEENRAALMRILALLVSMTGLAGPAQAFAFLRNEAASYEPHSIGRLRHTNILRLLRPMEVAVRRLVIIAARGLVGKLPACKPKKKQPKRKPATRHVSLPLIEPNKPFRLNVERKPKQPKPSPGPRIRFFDASPLVPIFQPRPKRRPPVYRDRITTARLMWRMVAIARVLENIPRKAQHLANWRARRDALGNSARRFSPVRPGPAPYSHPSRARRHEIHDIAINLHSLAHWAWQPPDTS